MVLVTGNDLARIGIGNPSVIFDVGAHLGQTTLHFRKSFPTAYIHSFEPVYENFSKLKLNTKGKDRVQINQLALGSSQSSVMMKTGQSDLTHQVCHNPEKFSSNGEIPMVQMDTIDSSSNKKESRLSTCSRWRRSTNLRF